MPTVPHYVLCDVPSWVPVCPSSMIIWSVVFQPQHGDSKQFFSLSSTSSLFLIFDCHMILKMMASSTWSLTVMTMMMMTIMEADGDNVLQRLSIHEHFSQVSVNHVTCGGQKGMNNEVNSEKKKSQIRNKLHLQIYPLG